jgi:hypothetical protein
MPVDQHIERRHPRVRSSVAVLFGTETPDREAVAETLSLGGLYIRTNDTLKVGTRIVLRMALPEREVQMHGEVVWSIRVPRHLERDLVCGMGVRFLGGEIDWPAVFRRWKDDFARG